MFPGSGSSASIRPSRSRSTDQSRSTVRKKSDASCCSPAYSTTATPRATLSPQEPGRLKSNGGWKRTDDFAWSNGSSLIKVKTRCLPVLAICWQCSRRGRLERCASMKPRVTPFAPRSFPHNLRWPSSSTLFSIQSTRCQLAKAQSNAAKRASSEYSACSSRRISKDSFRNRSDGPRRPNVLVGWFAIVSSALRAVTVG